MWKKTRLDIAFVALCLVFGLAFILVTPPFEAPDEPNHFYRAYLIAGGQLNAERRAADAGGVIPASLVRTVDAVIDDIPFQPENKQDLENVRKTFSFSLNPEDARFVSFRDTAKYSFVPYVPQVLGVFLGKALGLPPIWLMYLGRFTNLLVATLMIGGAIRLTPLFKGGFFLIGLMPMSIYLLASLSPDAPTTSLAFVLIALLLRIAYHPDVRLNVANLTALLGIIALLAACKNAYFLLAFLFFLIPVRKAASPRSYLLAGLLAVTTSVSSFLAWTQVAANVYVPFYRGGFESFRAAEQFILQHPLPYARMLAQNLLDWALFYIHSFVGILGWLDTRLPVLFVVLYLGVLVAVAIFEGGKEVAVETWQKLIILAIVAGTVALILTSQFVTWTGSNAWKISALQGRYFIPIAPLVFLLLYNTRFTWRLARERVHRLLIAFAAGSLAYTLLIVYRRFYA